MKKSFRNVGLISAFILVGAVSVQAKQQAPKDVIPVEAARKSAVAAMPGKVITEKLENEDGHWVYAFDMKTSDSKVHEVQIDARTGKIVGTDMESDDVEKN